MACAGLGLHPANKRPRYLVTTSLIGWAQALESALMCIHGIIDCGTYIAATLEILQSWLNHNQN